MRQNPPMTVVETANFITAATRCLPNDERESLIDFLGKEPECGDVIPGTGGVRKVRWAIGSKGKSGGVRVIYYYHSETIPLFLLTAYAKSQKGNLTMAEKNAMRQIVSDLVRNYRGQQP